MKIDLNPPEGIDWGAIGYAICLTICLSGICFMVLIAIAQLIGVVK